MIAFAQNKFLRFKLDDDVAEEEHLRRPHDPQIPQILKITIVDNNRQMLCGTEPFPETFRAKKYKLHSNFFTKKDFFHVMLNLPVEVNVKKKITQCLDLAPWCYNAVSGIGLGINGYLRAGLYRSP